MTFPENKERLVSIVVPVFNGEKHISRCLESIVNQDYRDIEIIVVNDGSTDKTRSIVEEFVQRDSRIVLYSTSNSGVAKARNFGIDKANGSFLMFVDSDDCLEKDYINNYICSYQSEDLIIGGYSLCFEKEGKVFKYRCKNQSYSIGGFLKDVGFYVLPPYLLGPCFKLFLLKNVLVNGIRFPEDLSYGEDTEFVLRYLGTCSRIKAIEDCGYNYRKHSKSTLSTVFLENKMGIFSRLAKDLESLFVQNRVSDEFGVVNSLLKDNFVLYCHELVASKCSYSKKKKLFFENAKKYNIRDLLKKQQSKTSVVRLIIFSIDFHIFWLLNLLFRINDLKYRRRF